MQRRVDVFTTEPENPARNVLNPRPSEQGTASAEADASGRAPNVRNGAKSAPLAMNEAAELRARPKERLTQGIHEYGRFGDREPKARARLLLRVQS
jgi:hypothetical protein